jgi:hypothetical protein
MAAGTDFILDALTREGLNHLFMVPADWSILFCRRLRGIPA